MKRVSSDKHQSRKRSKSDISSEQQTSIRSPTNGSLLDGSPQSAQARELFLADELIYHILHYLGLSALSRAERVCKQWRSVSSMLPIWNTIDVAAELGKHPNSFALNSFLTKIGRKESMKGLLLDLVPYIIDMYRDCFYGAFANVENLKVLSLNMDPYGLYEHLKGKKLLLDELNISMFKTTPVSIKGLLSVAGKSLKRFSFHLRNQESKYLDKLGGSLIRKICNAYPNLEVLHVNVPTIDMGINTVSDLVNIKRFHIHCQKIMYISGLPEEIDTLHLSSSHLGDIYEYGVDSELIKSKVSPKELIVNNVCVIPMQDYIGFSRMDSLRISNPFVPTKLFDSMLAYNPPITKLLLAGVTNFRDYHMEVFFQYLPTLKILDITSTRVADSMQKIPIHWPDLESLSIGNEPGPLPLDIRDMETPENMASSEYVVSEYTVLCFGLMEKLKSLRVVSAEITGGFVLQGLWTALEYLDVSQCTKLDCSFVHKWNIQKSKDRRNKVPVLFPENSSRTCKPVSKNGKPHTDHNITDSHFKYQNVWSM